VLGKLSERISTFQPKKVCYFELKKHKTWFDEACIKHRQANLQWLLNPSEINGDTLKNIRREASRYFRNKKGGGVNI
jgi:hypothetical protein